MFHFLYKSVLNGRYTITASPTHKLYSFQKNPSILCFKYMSSNATQHSFTVSYLINSCGLSPESALSASRHVHFETPDKPDSVIDFFKKHGFSQTQITNVIKQRPTLLLSDTEKTLLPKLEFFHSKGVSSPDLTRMLSNFPAILKTSLEKQIIPTFNFFNNLFQSEEKTIAAIRRFTDILRHKPETSMATKIKILRENGVPESNIVTLLQYHIRVICLSRDRFEEVVEEVKKMGFNPLRSTFVVAVTALSQMSKSTWERKVDVYKRWGWSKEEVLVAFGKHPTCMMASEIKIMAVMDFLINKMGWESSVIAKYPYLLSLSLEKRILPRCFVTQVLLSKGLISRASLGNSLVISEKSFLQKFVTRYEDQAPHLLKLYQEKMDLSNKSGMRLGKGQVEGTRNQ